MKNYFFILLYFLCFSAGFFFKIASFQNWQNIQVFGYFLDFNEQSRENKAFSRAGYHFISSVCGSELFCSGGMGKKTKISSHLAGTPTHGPPAVMSQSEGGEGWGFVSSSPGCRGGGSCSPHPDAGGTNLTPHENSSPTGGEVRATPHAGHIYAHVRVPLNRVPLHR